MRGLIEDVNQKKGQHEGKNAWWSERGVLVVRSKLPYGDYILAPPIVVDTKRDIQELAYDIKNDHVRFRNAAIKAMECGSHLVILVENEDGVSSIDDLSSWTEPESTFAIRSRKSSGKAKRYEGSQLAEACRTMTRKYGLEFDFCEPGEAGRRVLEHLGVVME